MELKNQLEEKKNELSQLQTENEKLRVNIADRSQDSTSPNEFVSASSKVNGTSFIVTPSNN